MRLDIRYRAAFTYEEPVREAHNELRVRPRDLPGQRLLAHRVTCTPLCRVLSFTDYWGTTVDHIGQIAEHDEFEIVAEASVETRPTKVVDTAPLDHRHREPFALDHLEFLESSHHTEPTDELRTRARDLVAGAIDCIDAVDRIATETHGCLVYTANSTRIGIPLAELVAGGVGVCQDYAHLCIALLRSASIPARYVSGYLFATDESVGVAPGEGEEGQEGTSGPGADGSPIRVQTHAWVEAAIPGKGWYAVDPTNAQPVAQRHVVIGYGRDYDDVAPIRGVYLGGSTPDVDAHVEMRRMDTVNRDLTPPTRRQIRQQPAPPRPDPQVAQQQQQQQQQQ